MSKLLRMGLMLGLIGFIFAPGARAQGGVMGICQDASWLPGGSNYCTLATPTMDFGTTSNSNPTFEIGLSATSTTSTDLVVLVPNGTPGALGFSATFTVYNHDGSPTGQTVTVAATALSTQFTSGNLLSGALGLTVKGADDYNFSQVQSHELVPSTPGFAVYYLSASSLGLTSGQYATVSFSFTNGSGFPYGTIFLALGDTNGTITQVTPWTTSLQDTTPEPMTLSLFGTGLLGIAWLTRRRMLKDSAAEEGKGSGDSGD